MQATAFQREDRDKEKEDPVDIVCLTNLRNDRYELGVQMLAGNFQLSLVPGHQNFQALCAQREAVRVQSQGRWQVRTSIGLCIMHAKCRRFQTCNKQRRR